MDLSMWLGNLLAYCLQIAVLVFTGTALVYSCRLKKPSVLLAFWQGLLLACLLLPVLQPWKPLTADPPQSLQPLGSLPAPRAAPAANPAPSRPIMLTARAVAIVLAAGIAIRLLRLLTGLLRLRFLRLSERRFDSDILESISAAVAPTGVSHVFLLSNAIDSPVTFGLRRPVVLLPASFAEMGEATQRLIACHELLHVRRRDWAFIVAEEFLLALLWFHPAVWWVVARIRLSREQVVDREVLRITEERESYLKTLLEIATRRSRSVVLPAPLLLRERNLVERIALMLEEASMTRSRLIVSMAGIIGLLICTGTLGAYWFPLQSGASVQLSTEAPQAPKRDPIRVGGNVQDAKLIKRVEPVYPKLAREARVQGIVILQVTSNEAGEVVDAKVLRGHPLLNESAVEAVKQWRYEPTMLNGEAVPVIATVTVQFGLRNTYHATLDSEGYLTGEDGLEGSALREKMTVSEDILIRPAPGISYRTLEGALRVLYEEGLRFRISGPYVLREGQLFYRAGAPGIQPPVVTSDNEALAELARAAKVEIGARAKEITGESFTWLEMRDYFSHLLFIDSQGGIVGIQWQGSLPPWLKIDMAPLKALEEEIHRTARVASPAYVGADPVPFVYRLSIRP